MKELKRVPKLRFKEFTSEWIVKKTKEIAPLQRGFDLPTSDVNEGNYPVVYSNGILRNHNKFRVASPGVVTGRSGTIGKVTYVETDFWPHNTTLWVTSFCNNNPKFIYYFYLNFKLDRYNAGSTVPTLNRNDVHSIKKAIPNLPEQQKIATFLSSVDKKIEQLQQKKTLLQQYKKGVMQKIFSQELRFKDDDGNDYAGWEEKKLSEISKTVSYGIGSAAIEFDGKNQYLRITDIDDETNSFKPKPLTSPEEPIDEKYYLKDDDIVFARTGASVGKSYLYNKKDGILVYAGFLIKFSIVNANAKFVFYYTLTAEYWKWVAVMSMRSGQPGLNAEELKSLSFMLPSLAEQTKIANFLSAIDDKIELVNTQLENTQQFKKGLLQQMFV